MTEELKGCPFCGCKARLWEGDWSEGGFGVVCTKCGVTLDPKDEDPIKAWNTRAASQQSKPDVVTVEHGSECPSHKEHFLWHMKQLYPNGIVWEKGEEA